MTHPRTITLQSPAATSSEDLYRQRSGVDGTYKASVRWAGSKRLANALAAMLLGAVASYYLRSSPLAWLVMLLPSAILFYVLANRSEVTLSRQGVARVIGPLPWPNARVSVPFDALRSFSIVRHARKVNDNVFDEGSLFGPAPAAESGRVVEKWELVANIESGPPVMLAKNLARDEAYALVEALNDGFVQLSPRAPSSGSGYGASAF